MIIRALEARILEAEIYTRPDTLGLVDSRFTQRFLLTFHNHQCLKHLRKSYNSEAAFEIVESYPWRVDSRSGQRH